MPSVFSCSYGLHPRHTYCTRFLYTILPAELYWGDATLDCLNEALATDLSALYRTGVPVSELATNVWIENVPVHIIGLGEVSASQGCNLSRDLYDTFCDAGCEGRLGFSSKGGVMLCTCVEG